MEVWIPITLMAATAQTVRFMLQKHLKSTSLSTAGATLSRFWYSAPLVALIMISYASVSGQAFPTLGGRFWIFALVGGMAQILATLCVVELFSHRNFAVGITFKKTEALQTGILGYLLLGEGVSRSGIVAILVGFLGVIILSDSPERASASFRKSLFNRAAGLGMLSGILFAVSAVGYRGASLSLASGDVFLRAGTTLAIVTASQTAAMTGWLAWRDRDQIGAVIRAWRVASLVGLTSMVGSFGWFIAFTLQNAAYVKTLGQVELILSLAASVYFFREKVTARELSGMAILVMSILILVAFN